MATLTSQTLLIRAQLEDICAFTQDPTYHIHTEGDQVCLRHYRFPEHRIVSPLMSQAAMEGWLDGFLVGLDVGYLTAKRGK
jgi:hypothetical protein